MNDELGVHNTNILGSVTLCTVAHLFVQAPCMDQIVLLKRKLRIIITPYLKFDVMEDLYLYHIPGTAPS